MPVVTLRTREKFLQFLSERLFRSPSKESVLGPTVRKLHHSPVVVDTTAAGLGVASSVLGAASDRSIRERVPRQLPVWRLPKRVPWGLSVRRLRERLPWELSCGTFASGRRGSFRCDNLCRQGVAVA